MNEQAASLIKSEIAKLEQERYLLRIRLLVIDQLQKTLAKMKEGFSPEDEPCPMMGCGGIMVGGVVCSVCDFRKGERSDG